ncbi:MAG TPA: PDZ domain-containing protein [Candidatus Acidoferrales bacterium]|nr:PDZ domain-containing protein [Candidatus Acidoferrales bacterium]
MKPLRRNLIALFALLISLGLAQSAAFAQAAHERLAFTVSMPHPANHTFHVVLRAAGIKGELQDFKMPVWSPGFYGIGDYARNVTNFRAADGAGHALPWEKVTRNTWRVAAGNVPRIELDYDVYGDISFAANSYLGDDRAYISPSGIFVFPAGMPGDAVTVAIQLPPQWKQIATGLEPVPGGHDTFSAANFDVLYDSPILMGNQEILRFDVKGVPHYVALENVPATVDRQKMVADLKRMVTAATELIGDVPYKHYTFLMMGRGNGGIEHLNSASIQFNGNSIESPSGYMGWLSYVSHEYFHNFNVKRIRPIALGPFNYDMENLTHMLWVSEGLTVYYENLVLVRAGLMTRDQYLEAMARAITTFENSPGHHYQSATESSWNTWNTGSGIGGDRGTTISYYDNGAMLGAMLDLAIREGSRNRKSLDDVMRALYRKYYLGKHRGFTDAEFRQECEAAAGGDLSEVFSYASTTMDADYAKYFAYAGLKLDSAKEDAPGAYLGLNTHTEELSPSEAAAAAGGGLAFGRRGGAPQAVLVITSVIPGSPAASAGLMAGDQILEVDGVKATPAVLNGMLTPPQAARSGRRGPATQAAQAPPAVPLKNPGDKVALQISRNGSQQEVSIVLGKNFRRTFRFEAAETPTAMQQAILGNWLRPAQ